MREWLLTMFGILYGFGVLLAIGAAGTLAWWALRWIAGA